MKDKDSKSFLARLNEIRGEVKKEHIDVFDWLKTRMIAIKGYNEKIFSKHLGIVKEGDKVKNLKDTALSKTSGDAPLKKGDVSLEI